MEVFRAKFSLCLDMFSIMEILVNIYLNTRESASPQFLVTGGGSNLNGWPPLHRHGGALGRKKKKVTTPSPLRESNPRPFSQVNKAQPSGLQWQNNWMDFAQICIADVELDVHRQIRIWDQYCFFVDIMSIFLSTAFDKISQLLQKLINLSQTRFNCILWYRHCLK